MRFYGYSKSKEIQTILWFSDDADGFRFNDDINYGQQNAAKFQVQRIDPTD